MEGILEETFTAIEFIKGKADSPLSVAQVLEEKHGYGAAIKKDGFSSRVWDCLPKLIEFVSYEIYSNTSKLLKSVKVRILSLLPAISRQPASITLHINSWNAIQTSKGQFYGIQWDLPYIICCTVPNPIRTGF